MFKKSWIAAGLLMMNASVGAQQSVSMNTSATVVQDQAAKQLLLGTHRLSLQWISLTKFGRTDITESDGRLMIKGDQKSDQSSDYLHIEGIITQVDARSFSFSGSIVTKVSDINNDQTCTRHGEMTFRKSGKRGYWRLQEMQNPCVPAGDMTTDYVDVYLR